MVNIAPIERILLICTAIVYVLTVMTDVGLFDWLLVVLIILLIGLFLPQMRGMLLLLTVLFLAVGIAITLYNDTPLHTWRQMITMNANLVTLFVFAPMFGIPVHRPDYVFALRTFYERLVTKRSIFFIGTQLLTHGLSIVMNVGSIPVVHYLASVNRLARDRYLLMNAINRGFILSIAWSPYFAAMALVTSSLRIEWVKIIPFLLGYAFICFIVGYLEVFVRQRKRGEKEGLPITDNMQEPDESAATTTEETKTYSMWSLLHLLVYLLSSIIVVLVIEKWLSWSIVLIICLSALCYPLLWCIINRTLRLYIEGMRRHVEKSVLSIKKEIVLFLAAGFFSGAISMTPLAEWMMHVLDQSSASVTLWFTLVVLVIFFFGSMIGLHPIVLVTILVMSVDLSVMDMSTRYFAVLLLGCWAATNAISPASAANHFLANLSNVPVFVVARQNYMYAIIMLLVLPFYLLLFVR